MFVKYVILVPFFVWIFLSQICIPNTDLDPDPGQPNYCGSGFRPKSTTLSIRHKFKKYGVHFEPTNQNHTLIFYFPSRFEVPAKHRTFFSDVNFHGAAATFFHAVCVVNWGTLRRQSQSPSGFRGKSLASMSQVTNQFLLHIQIRHHIRIRNIKMSQIRSTAPSLLSLPRKFSDANWNHQIRISETDSDSWDNPCHNDAQIMENCTKEEQIQKGTSKSMLI